jgi:hypothetical protein
MFDTRDMHDCHYHTFWSPPPLGGKDLRESEVVEWSDYGLTLSTEGIKRTDLVDCISKKIILIYKYLDIRIIR